MKYSQGQTFVEVVIIVSLVVVVITALVSGSISSLKITGYNTQKSQATKFAQEGVEIARRERDTSWRTFYNKSQPSPRTWCINKLGVWIQQNPCTVNIDNTFTRSIRLTYNAANERIETLVTVTWLDGSTVRTSKIETFFTQWR